MSELAPLIRRPRGPKPAETKAEPPRQRPEGPAPDRDGAPELARTGETPRSYSDEQSALNRARLDALVERTMALAASLGIKVPGRPPALQTKLVIGRPDDAFEREADRVADTIGRAGTPSLSPAPTAVQRKCAACEAGQGPCATCAHEDGPKDEAGHDETLRRDAAGGRATPSSVPPIVQEVLGGPGRPLDRGARAALEPRFGASFADVRVHDDARAERSAEAVGARAYTVGRHIVFGAGQYRPAEGAGRKLLAHELTHVLQQARGGQAAVHREVVQRQPDERTAAAATGAPREPATNVELGVLKVEAFQIQRKDERTWVAVISARLARQIPAEQVIVLGTVAVAGALLRETDAAGAPTRPPPIETLLAIARDTAAVGTRVREAEPNREAELALVNVDQSALDAIRTRLPNKEKIVQVPLSAKDPRVATNFPESFPQGFVAGAALETAGEPLHGRSVTLKDLALMYLGFNLGEGEGVVV
ncbi:MAG TPA: DUF4157 domain-containing protein, partial [Polyangia bacterium]|nr:DUF4157 domain-containing protein [Polyangia bacterium]